MKSVAMQVRSLANKLQVMETKHDASVASIRSKYESLVAQAQDHDSKLASKLGFKIPAHHGGSC